MSYREWHSGRVAGQLRTAAQIVVTFGIALYLPGCEKSIDQLYGKEAISATHDEAATTHVAVLSVAPWAEVASSLQPSFKLSSADALTQAIPTTQAIEEKLVEAFMTKVGIGLPSTSSAATETLTESSVVNRAVDAAGTETNTEQSSSEEKSTETETKEPGKVPTPTLPTGTPSALSLPGIGIAGQKVSDDPFLRYAAATALFQEAALLDQYVKNAAQRTGYVPYLVRMQLSVMAHKRNQPYDIYADMSFFLRQQLINQRELISKEEAERRKKDAETATNAAQDARGKAQAARELAKSGATDAIDQAVQAEAAALNAEMARDEAIALVDDLATASSCQEMIAKGSVPEVIPLLATDNLEAALRSKAIDQITQFALALNLMIKGVGANVDTSATQEDFAALVGKDLNSLFTVAKMSGNTMRARIGALNQVETRYATTSRTHNLSLLVMVPQSYIEACDPTLTLLAQTTLRHVRTGQVVEPIKSAKFYKEVRSLYESWYPELADCIDDSQPDKVTEVENAMDNAILTGNFKRFKDAIFDGIKASRARDCKKGPLAPTESTDTTPPKKTAQDVEDQAKTPSTEKSGDDPFAYTDFGYLWQDVLSLLQSYGISQVDFSLPYKKQKSAPPPTQIALLLDTGTIASARLQGADLTDAKVLAASLQKRIANESVPLLVAQSVSKEGTALVAQFPSPVQWGIAVDSKGPAKAETYLAIWNSAVEPVTCTKTGPELGTLDGKPGQIIGACYQLSYLNKPEDTSPKVAILQSSTTIVGNSLAEGKVAFGAMVPKDAKEIRVRVTNAELINADVYKFFPVIDPKQPVAGTVELRNLDEDKPVVLIVEALNAEKASMAAANATYQVKLPEEKKKAE